MSGQDERSIPATQRRLLRARQQGMAPVRRMPIALGGVAGVALGVAVWDLPRALLAQMRAGLDAGGHAMPSAASAVGQVVGGVLQACWPALLLGVAGACAGALVQTGGVLAWRRSRASVAGRVSAMAAPSAWGRAGAGLLWMACAFAAAGAVVGGQWERLSALPRAPLSAAVTEGVDTVLLATLAAFAALTALAVADALIAGARWRERLAMTPAEAREEQRSTDGDPQVRQRRRRGAREALRAIARRTRSARAERARTEVA